MRKPAWVLFLAIVAVACESEPSHNGDDSGDPGGAGLGGEAGDGGGAGASGTEPRGGAATGGRAGSGAVSGEGGEAGTGAGGRSGSSGAGTAGRDGGGSGDGGAAGSAGDGHAGDGGEGTDPPPVCAEAADCARDQGATPCGWTCEAGVCRRGGASCSDRDGDGYGVGSGCACAADCDDGDAAMGTTGTRSCCRSGTGTQTCEDGEWGACTGGAPSSGESCDGEDDDCDGIPDDGLGVFGCGMGACRVEVPACVAGELSTCTPLTPTATTDDCNDEDDDCDGAVDEDCDRCIRVAPDGDDAAALQSGGTTPFASVQAAIDFADDNRDEATRVCVAAGDACGAQARFTTPDGSPLTMRNGIDVLGGYESAGWTRCTDSTATLAPQAATGVLFPSTISERTILDGVTVERYPGGTTSAVTVDGAREVLLSHIVTVGDPAATNHSYGVNLIHGAEAVIFASRVDGGSAGVTESIGVRSVGARVVISDSPAIAVRATFGSTNPTFAVAVLLDNAPGSRVERSVIACSDQIRNGCAAIRVTGDARNVVLLDNTVTTPYLETTTWQAGILAESCGGADPWIVGNSVSGGFWDDDTPLQAAICAVGDCHPIIEGNTVRITGGGVGGGGIPASGIDCRALDGTPSRCVLAKNDVANERRVITTPVTASGLGARCAGGSCARLSRNTILGLAILDSPLCSSPGRCVYSSGGVHLEGSDALIEGNIITGGCASSSGTGLYAADGRPRIENNVITGSASTCGAAGTASGTAMFLSCSSGSCRFDVHSNRLKGNVAAAPCTSTGISLNGTGLAGIFRNNVIESRVDCGSTSYAFAEKSANVDPEVFEHNVLTSYLDENLTPLTALQVNALGDMTSAGNLQGTCAEPLTSGSICIDAGTVVGAPLTDRAGNLRDVEPDIGPDEFVP